MKSGYILASLRESKGLTQAELSERIGKTQGTIGHWESGRNKIPPKMLPILADYFGVSIDYLMGRDDKLQTVLSDSPIVNVPLINASAGIFQGDYSQIDEVVELPSKLNRLLNKSFAIRVSGDSMDKILPNGHIVICEDILKTAYKPKNNDIVVCEHDGEYTIKQLIETTTLVILEPQSTNPKYKSIVFEKSEELDLKIIGVVKYGYIEFE